MPSLKSVAGRVLLVIITLWALAIVVPDLYRLHHPLGSFGFYANNDGLVTDVLGPFPNLGASPAFAAGLRPGDRLDLAQMRCVPLDTLKCASAMAALGSMRLVTIGQRAEVALAATADRPTREVDIVAQKRPYNRWVLAVL